MNRGDSMTRLKKTHDLKIGMNRWTIGGIKHIFYCMIRVLWDSRLLPLTHDQNQSHQIEIMKFRGYRQSLIFTLTSWNYREKQRKRRYYTLLPKYGALMSISIYWWRVWKHFPLFCDTEHRQQKTEFTRTRLTKNIPIEMAHIIMQNSPSSSKHMATTYPSSSSSSKRLFSVNPSPSFARRRNLGEADKANQIRVVDSYPLSKYMVISQQLFGYFQQSYE